MNGPTRICVFNINPNQDVAAPIVPNQTGSNLIDIVTAVDGVTVQSLGAASAGVPVVLNPSGVIDSSLFVGSTNFTQISGCLATSQICSVQGTGAFVQLTSGAPPPSPVTTQLGSSANYALLAYSGITNAAPATSITGGKIGSAPTMSITGFNPPTATVDNTDAPAARTAGQAAYTYYSGLTPTQTGLANLSTNDGGGGVGVYHAGVFSGGALDIPTTITLDAQGDPNAIFVFIAASTVTLESGASILLVNGAQAANVVWCVGSSFTSVATSTMVGNILAYASITLGGGILTGRALAVGGGNGAVSISAATAVTVPSGSGAITAGDIVTFDELGNTQDSGVSLEGILSGTFVNPMTADGDMIYEGLAGSPPVLGPLRLPIGTTGQVLTVVAGLPVWQPATGGGGGGVTSVYGSTGVITTLASPAFTGTATAAAINASGIVQASTFEASTAGTLTNPAFSFTVAGKTNYGMGVNNGAGGLALVVNGAIALDITPSQTYFASQRSLKLTTGTTIYENPTGTLSIGQSNDASGTLAVANIALTGTLKDSTSSVGTSGQVLSSTVTGTQWVALVLAQTFAPTLAGSPPEYEYLTGYNASTGLFSAAPIPAGGGGGAGTFVTLSVTGDASASDIQDWFSNGTPSTPVVSVDSFGDVNITPLAGGAVAALTVLGVGETSGVILGGKPDYQLDPTTLSELATYQAYSGYRFVTTNSLPSQFVSITSIQITSNIATFQAVNTLSAGDRVEIGLFAGLSAATFLNRHTVVVLPTGLSGTQFEAAFTHADYGPTADSGSGISYSVVNSASILSQCNPFTGNQFISGLDVVQAIQSTGITVSGAQVFPQGVTGLRVRTNHENTGNITSPGSSPWYGLVGAAISVNNFHGASVPNAAALVLDIGQSVSGSHMDNAYGIFLTSNGDPSGTITNSFNIYIQRQNVGSATKRFAIYEVNPQEQNVLGAVDVGSRLQAIRHTPYGYTSPNNVIEADSPAANTDFAGQVTLLSGNTTVVYSFVNNYTGAGQPILVVTPTSNLGAANPIWITYQGATNAWTGFTVNVGTAPLANVIFNYVVIGQV
jgi:hypothetical protein